MLWHQRLIHCGSHSLQSASLYVDGVPNLSAFNFDDILKCPTCLKVNLTKNFGKKSLRNSVERPYQGLFIDFFFSGKIKRHKKGVVIEASRADIEVMNGKTAWILSSDAQTRMLHGNTRLSLPLSNTWNLSCSNIPLSARINGLSSIKVENYTEILMSEISSRVTIIQSILLVQILHHKMVMSNKPNVQSLMVSKVV